MKFENKLFIMFFIIVLASVIVTSQSESASKQKNAEPVLVAFEFESCTKKIDFEFLV